MRRLIVASILFTFTVGAAKGEVLGPAPTAAAWLAEVDAGRYDRAWSHADPLLQAAVPQATFVQGLKGAREPLGGQLDRALSDDTAAASLPGAPDGDYALLTYRTRFARKSQAVETVVMRREADGWKASGYHVR